MKPIRFLLNILILAVFLFQVNARAEALQGTIHSIDSSAHRIDVKPEGNADPDATVKVITAPGVKYTGIDSLGALQVGDYVKVQASYKSRSGDALEATSIEKTASNAAGTVTTANTTVVPAGTQVHNETTSTTTTY